MLFVSKTVMSFTFLVILLAFNTIRAEVVNKILPEQLVSLRSGGGREWSEFPENIELAQFEHRFDSETNANPWTLSIRQQDVKEIWNVSINGKSIGRLTRDENDLRCDFEIPAELLNTSENKLEIRCSSDKNSDDIRIGEIEIHNVAPTRLRSGSTIEIVIHDVNQHPIPGRVTIVDLQGTLIPINIASANATPSTLKPSNQNTRTQNNALAKRHGVVYTANGRAIFGVQPGTYRIYAGRGFEYSVETLDVQIAQGQYAKRTVNLQRQVDTKGWVACDTHVHTVTHSGHGDCTIAERMVTIAGEGIELPIATDHNTQIDYTTPARLAGVNQWFTPVVGNEVTTQRGHFNIFPTSSDSQRPNHQAPDWSELFDSIFENQTVKIAILNHARDLHSSFRPFSPRHHISLTGTNLDDFDRRFNAMELINSGAVQTTPMQLFGDWCGLINNGMQVTPVGSSDSHDVTRYIVGQGRTYIACDDSQPNQIPVNAAVTAFLQGQVVVSYGLFANLRANQQAGPGDLLELGENEPLKVDAEVRHPDWTEVTSIELWVNGEPRISQKIDPGSHPLNADSTPTPSDSEVKSHRVQFSWEIPREELSSDVWLSLVARGPGVRQPYWPTAKPYQPDSIDFSPYVFSSTGPLRVDVDGDGAFSSAADYASQIVDQLSSADDNSPINLQLLADELQELEPAISHQVLAMLRPNIDQMPQLIERLEHESQTNARRFEQAWLTSLRAQLERIE